MRVRRQVGKYVCNYRGLSCFQHYGTRLFVQLWYTLPHMSHDLNSLRGSKIGDYMWGLL